MKIETRDKANGLMDDIRRLKFTQNEINRFLSFRLGKARLSSLEFIHTLRRCDHVAETFLDELDACLAEFLKEKHNKLDGIIAAKEKEFESLGGQEMGRYLLFYGSAYEAAGGMRDFEGDFDDLRDAINKANKFDESEKKKWDWKWCHIYDSVERRIVWEDGEEK